MRYLLDTCVISELVRPKPARSVADWVRAQPEEHLYLSVLTLGEIRKGLERLAAGPRRTRLETWLDRDLRMRFSGRWLAIEEEVAERWGMVTARAADQGRTLPAIDGLIAATALTHGMTVATRNTADLAVAGVATFNPWADA